MKAIIEATKKDGTRALVPASFMREVMKQADSRRWRRSRSLVLRARLGVARGHLLRA